jgi:hypothetical protein
VAIKGPKDRAGEEPAREKGVQKTMTGINSGSAFGAADQQDEDMRKTEQDEIRRRRHFLDGDAINPYNSPG